MIFRKNLRGRVFSKKIAKPNYCAGHSPLHLSSPTGNFVWGIIRGLPANDIKR